MGPAHPRRGPGQLPLTSGRRTELFSLDDGLTLPHPLAHLRAFVLIPWLAVDPDATLTVAGGKQSVAKLLDELDAAERDGVRLTELVLEPRASET